MFFCTQNDTFSYIFWERLVACTVNEINLTWGVLKQGTGKQSTLWFPSTLMVETLAIFHKALRGHGPAMTTTTICVKLNTCQQHSPLTTTYKLASVFQCDCSSQSDLTFPVLWYSGISFYIYLFFLIWQQNEISAKVFSKSHCFAFFEGQNVFVFVIWYL